MAQFGAQFWAPESKMSIELAPRKEYSGKDDNAKEALKLWKAFAGKKSVVEEEEE